MKRLIILHALVQILFSLSLLLMFFLVPFWVLSFTYPHTIPFKVNGEMVAATPIIAKAFAGLMIVGIAFFIYALYIFKQILDLFLKKRIFNPDVIKNFRLIGRSILLGYIFSGGGSILYNLSRNESSIDFNFIAGSIFIICLGLFFFVLSEVFQTAKNIKEENELTI